jgi:septal ring factor EnvC (AmiA/AmiB activator)
MTRDSNELLTRLSNVRNEAQHLLRALREHEAAVRKQIEELEAEHAYLERAIEELEELGTPRAEEARP